MEYVNMTLAQKVIIKVHGATYETFQTTLQRYPMTRLASHIRRNEPQITDNAGVITLDCRASVFDAILFYYQSYGILRCPTDVKMEDFVTECRRLEISEQDIRKMQEKDGFLYTEPLKLESSRLNCQMSMWRFLESPESSAAASLFAIFNCLMIAAATSLSCIQTLPWMKSSEKLSFHANPILLFELTLNLFFGIEYFLRITSSPDKRKFLRSVWNVMDFFSVYPYFAVLIIDAKNLSTVKFLRIVRIVRIFRLIRLTKHSKTLQTAVRIMGNCVGDLITMLLIIFISCLICGTIEYTAEANVHGTKFTSIPQSLWWAAQTVIPVGYGDIIPQSTIGKIIGGMVVVMSSLTFALPLLFLGGKFLKYYSKTFGVTVHGDFRPKRARSSQ